MKKNNLKKTGLLLLFVLSVIYCRSQENIDFIKVDMPLSRPITEENEHVIKSADELSHFYQEHQLDIISMRKTNFDTHMLIAVFRGYCGTTGHRIEIEDIYQLGDEMVVKVVYYNPGKNCFVGDAVTYPYAVVELLKSDLEIKFEKFAKVDVCD